MSRVIRLPQPPENKNNGAPLLWFQEAGFPTDLSSGLIDEPHFFRGREAFQSKVQQKYSQCSKCQWQAYTAKKQHTEINIRKGAAFSSCWTCGVCSCRRFTTNNKVSRTYTFEKKDPHNSGALYHLVAT